MSQNHFSIIAKLHIQRGMSQNHFSIISYILSEVLCCLAANVYGTKFLMNVSNGLTGRVENSYT